MPVRQFHACSKFSFIWRNPLSQARKNAVTDVIPTCFWQNLGLVRRQGYVLTSTLTGIKIMP